MRARHNRRVDIWPEHDRWTAIEGEHGYIRARLWLLSTEDGGRKGPIASGYRSCWAFPPEVHDEMHDAPLTLESGVGEWLAPGAEAIVRLHPLAPDLWPPITPGIRLTMVEGARVVGMADVLEAVPPAI
ncbi:hypothetical protein GCM10023317_53880 [Actinopolymorpha pittospori]